MKNTFFNKSKWECKVALEWVNQTFYAPMGGVVKVGNEQ